MQFADDGKYRVMDCRLNIIIPAEYDEIREDAPGIWRVIYDDIFGYCNRQGIRFLMIERIESSLLCKVRGLL